MKALLICPAERQNVGFLAESEPLANLPALGKAMVVYWLEHLFNLGAREVRILQPTGRNRCAPPSATERGGDCAWKSSQRRAN